MAQPTNTYDSYDAANVNREDLQDHIFLTAQTETPYMSMIASESTATATYHEWLTDSLAAAADNAQIEGNDATNDAITAQTRVGNYTQISDKTIVTSGTQDVTDSVGGKVTHATELVKKGKELKRDMEYGLVRNNASVAGNATTARELGGLETWLTTNDSRGATGADGGFSGGTTSAPTDGTQRAFTETILTTNMGDVAASGGNPDVLMVGTFNKGVVSGFSGGATLNLDRDTKKIVNTVDIYVGDYGSLKVVWNPQQRDRTAFLLQGDQCSVAYLRRLKENKLAKTGDSVRSQMVVEYTNVIGNEAAHGVIADLTTS